MGDELTVQDCELILQSLCYTRQAFEVYQYYPSVEIKRQRVADVDVAMKKIRKAKNKNCDEYNPYR